MISIIKYTEILMKLNLRRKKFMHAIGGFHKDPVQRTWWSVIQKNLIKVHMKRNFLLAFSKELSK